jgi:hypothetical protein
MINEFKIQSNAFTDRIALGRHIILVDGDLASG